MKKIFKIICVFMSCVIAVSSLYMLSVLNRQSKLSFDPFGAGEVIEKIKNYEMNMTTVIYVKDDKNVWQEYQRLHGEENRIWVDIENMPEYLINAIVAIEDERFFTHGGVDWKRTAGAFLNYLPFIELYSSDQGGSTITQQLIKNVMDDKEKSAKRKVREIVRALIIESKMEKEEILEAYLNTISLGNGICGVQVAANYYFNKDVSELTLTECAAIAGITKNPSAYNPIGNPETNKKRRRTVLNKMLELGKISQQEYNDSYIEDITIDNTQQGNFEIEMNSWFVDALISNISEDLAEKYGCSESVASTMLYNGGYRIYATVNPEIQSTMEDVYLNVNRYFSQKSSKNKGERVQSAMTVMDYEGHILGIVGGVGEKTANRALNRAYDSPRQPGSTMKPLGAYAPAIDSGAITYATIIKDEPLKNFFGSNKDGPKNSYSGYRGKMSMPKALEISSNTIPCHIIKDYLGIDASFEFVTEKLKLKHITDSDRDLSSLALGGCQYGMTTTESAASYAVFGNGGKYYDPVTYYKVERAGGELILDGNRDGEQIIKPATATIMNRLLQNVVYGSSGTGRSIAGYNTMKAYAKTGTSSDTNDRWLVGGTPYYVASVWCGFDKPETVGGGVSAATVWRTVMSAAHKNLEKKEFVYSEDVVEEKYCRYSGLIAGDKCYSKGTGYFVPELLGETCSGKHSGSAVWDSNASKTSSAQQSSSSEQSSTASSSSQQSTTAESSSSHTSSAEKPPSTEQGSGGSGSEDTSGTPSNTE